MPDTRNISFTGWLLLIVHLLTIIGLVWTGASQYGSLRTRLEAVEAISARQVATSEAMANAIQHLAIALDHTQTLVDERTERRIDEERDQAARENHRAVQQSLHDLTSTRK